MARQSGLFNPPHGTNETNMKTEQLKQLREWLDNYPSWLSERTDYARGYKAGILQAMEIVRDIIRD